MLKDQIIQLWKSVGWNTLHDYHAHLRSGEHKIIFDELHPDRIHPREFWLACDEHFFTDPICNHNNLIDETLTREESNKLNYDIPLYMGMIGQIQGFISNIKNTMGYTRLCEIGCGYGSFYENFVTNNLNITYKGFDIIQRTEYARQIKGYDGCFNDNQVKEYTDTFNLFFSSNTFQHLSKNQIYKYLHQIYEMLEYGGYASLMYVVNSENSYHYGQSIELYTIQELGALIKAIGFSIVSTCSMNIKNSLTPYSFGLKK